MSGGLFSGLFAGAMKLQEAAEEQKEEESEGEASPDTAEADLEWLNARRVDMPVKCFDTKLKLHGGKLTLPRSYIYATRITPADTFGQFAKRTLFWADGLVKLRCNCGAGAGRVFVHAGARRDAWFFRGFLSRRIVCRCPASPRIAALDHLRPSLYLDAVLERRMEGRVVFRRGGSGDLWCDCADGFEGWNCTRRSDFAAGKNQAGSVTSASRRFQLRRRNGVRV